MRSFVRRMQHLLRFQPDTLPQVGPPLQSTLAAPLLRLLLLACGLFLAVALALWGQALLDASPRNTPNLAGLLLYSLAICCLTSTLLLEPGDGDQHWYASPAATELTLAGWRWRWLALSLLAAALAFYGAGENRFRWWGVLAWVLAMLLWVVAWWEHPLRLPSAWPAFRLRWQHLALLALLALGIWFRYWRLAEVPGDVNSDQIEKLYDVRDVLNGAYHIYFPRNTGREAMQFYLTAGLIRLFDLPLQALTLQIGTSLIGVLLLPGLYLLGRALWGGSAGLWLMFFGAVSSWAVIPARFGLRYPLLPTFAAWCFAFLVRGLRSGRRSDFLLLGLLFGAGLYGYSPFRGMALALPVAFGTVWVLRRGWRSPEQRLQAGHFLLALFTALLVCVPLLRFSLEQPEVFLNRVLTRTSSLERPIVGDPLAILAYNLKRVLLFFHWTSDASYVVSLPGKPVVDPITGALLMLGLVAALWWVVRRRDPVPLGLLAGGLVMLLPSALSLAFPIENPSTVRIGGALPVVLALAVLLPVLWTERWCALGGSCRWAGLLVVLLLGFSLLSTNVSRVFALYPPSYCARALNHSDAVAVIDGFYRQGGVRDQAFYVGYPHWFDHRLIGMGLDDLDWNNMIWHEQLRQVLPAQRSQPGPKLYLVHPEDRPSLALLQTAYPSGGWSFMPRSRCAGSGLLVFSTP